MNSFRRLASRRMNRRISATLDRYSRSFSGVFRETMSLPKWGVGVASLSTASSAYRVPSLPIRK